MSNKTLFTLVISGAMFASGASHADHNSIWGAGTANMPNDIHNTRIEDDAETFMHLVQYGDGVDSVNRYADDSETSDTLGVATAGNISRPSAGAARTMSVRPTASRIGRR